MEFKTFCDFSIKMTIFVVSALRLLTWKRRRLDSWVRCWVAVVAVSEGAERKNASKFKYFLVKNYYSWRLKSTWILWLSASWIDFQWLKTEMVGVGSTIMVSVFVQKINFALPAFWHWFLFLFFKKYYRMLTAIGRS